MSNLVAIKFAALAIIWAIIFIAIQLPLKVAGWFEQRGKRGQWMLSVLACFGGGVFFGVYMLHLAPEVEEIIQKHVMEPADIHYPIPQLLVGLGFFLLVFIDKTMHQLQHSSHRVKESQLPETAAQPQSEETTDVRLDGMRRTGSIPPAPLCGEKLDTHRSESQATMISIDEDEQIITQEERKSLAGMKAVMLFIALSADSVFEGLALGVQRRESGVWNLVLAIVGHEAVIAFMLGLEICKHYTTKTSFWLGFAYALADPVGILVGTILSITVGEPATFELVSGILQALCCGVFIYVTFLEILAREFAHSSSLVKTLAVFAGFGLMALVALMPQDQHDHDHGTPNVTATPDLVDIFSS